MKGSERRVRLWGVIAAALAAGFCGVVSGAPGDPLGPPLTVAAIVSGDYSGYANPTIARGTGDDMVTAWRSFNNGVYAVLQHADGTPKGSPFLVSADPNAGAPDVAMTANGDFVVAWSSVGVDVAGVYARRYRANGSALGSQLQVNDPFTAPTDQTVLLSPSVAMDATGNFIVAWGQGRELSHGDWHGCDNGLLGICTRIGAYSVRLRRYGGGGAQAQAVQTVDAAVVGEVESLRVPLAIGDGQDRISVAMAPDGRYVVAWDRVSDGVSLLSGVYARRYDASGRAEIKRQVASERTRSLPVVAMDAGGAYVVAYWRQPGLIAKSEGIYARSYPGGNGLGGTEMRVNMPGDTGTSRTCPLAVAMDAAGDFVVTWTGGGRIRAQRYANGGGALGINFDVANGQSGGGVCSSDVAMTAGGDFAVVWGMGFFEYPPDEPNGVLYAGIGLRTYDGP